MKSEDSVETFIIGNMGQIQHLSYRAQNAGLRLTQSNSPLKNSFKILFQDAKGVSGGKKEFLLIRILYTIFSKTYFPLVIF